MRQTALAISQSLSNDKKASTMLQHNTQASEDEHEVGISLWDASNYQIRLN